MATSYWLSFELIGKEILLAAEYFSFYYDWTPKLDTIDLEAD